MKTRKQKCKWCGGRGEFFNFLSNEDVKCPDCEGTGEEVLISPKQWKEYQWLEKIADELEAKHIEVSDLREDD